MNLDEAIETKLRFFPNRRTVYHSVWKFEAHRFAQVWVAEPCDTRRVLRGWLLLENIVNMTSCFEVEEKINEEDDRQKNPPREKDKTLATLEAMPMCLNWGKSLVFLTSIWLLSYNAQNCMLID